MKDHIEVIEIEDRQQWIAALGNSGLPSQSWHYAWALSASNVIPKLAVVRSGGARMLMPFFKRQWMGTTDAATLLSLSGASIAPSSAAPLSAWREFAAAQGWIAGYIQLSPWVDWSITQTDGELVTVNEVLLLDLRQENLLEQSSASIRQKIRNAARMGAVLVEDRALLAESVKQLYPSTLQRIGSRPQYDFKPESLERWVLDPSSLVLGARCGDAVEAVSLFSLAGAQAEYHINASSERGRELAAWLIWNAIVRLREKGVDALNLGGGAHPGDGIYQFKRRFGGVPKPLRAVRQIYDADKYKELCALAGVSLPGQWFPAYRAARPGA